ncbi:hypothetical protein GR217_22840 [Rhizobium leguminosarum]|uniref:HTH HARE-type domain-containing protein n=1 Tax=Rhizobium ruizarguesonis TaxID=2081791 RepID=A0AAE4YSP2_9HYPH|nr:hypothetical protein [Rhizobium ruizarguesonis]NEI50525.1 hypothetical protein [Rhizobium ruizarguesonis]
MIDTESTDDVRLRLVLADLRRQRAALEDTMTARMAEWRAEIENTTAAIRAIEVLLGVGHQIEGGSDGNSATTLVERKYTKKDNFSRKLRELARRAMIEAGHPLSRRDILSFALREGVELPSPDPAQFLGRVLWRSKEFVRMSDGYWLADRPFRHKVSL